MDVNYDLETEQLRTQLDLYNQKVNHLEADNRLLRSLVERQREAIDGYYKAIDTIHTAVREVYHGE